MASTFQVVTQYPGVVFLGGTNTQDVVFVGYNILNPDGSVALYLEVPIPKTVYNVTQVKDYGIGYAGTILAVLALPGVVGGEWTQTPTPAGELTSNIIVYVQSDSGNSQASITVPFSGLDPTLVQPKTDALVKTLNATEAL